MAPKRKKKKAPPVPATPPRSAPRFIRGLLRSVVEFFKDELPVSPVRGGGKFTTEVITKGEFQSAIVAVCAELPDETRVKATRWRCSALVTPTEGPDLRVLIGGQVVGELKPKDGKRLLQKMVEAHQDLYSLRVDAMIEGGSGKKGGKAKPFTIRLDIPVLYPPKPVKPAKESVATDDAPAELAMKAVKRPRKDVDSKAEEAANEPIANEQLSAGAKKPPARVRRRKDQVKWEDEPISPDRAERGEPLEL